jgi:hypothetical protein
LTAVVRFLGLTSVVRFLVLIAVVRFLVLIALSVAIVAQAIFAQAYCGFGFRPPVAFGEMSYFALSKFAAMADELESDILNIVAPKLEPSSSPSPASIAVQPLHEVKQEQGVDQSQMRAPRAAAYPLRPCPRNLKRCVKDYPCAEKHAQAMREGLPLRPCERGEQCIAMHHPSAASSDTEMPVPTDPPGPTSDSSESEGEARPNGPVGAAVQESGATAKAAAPPPPQVNWAEDWPCGHPAEVLAAVRSVFAPDAGDAEFATLIRTFPPLPPLRFWNQDPAVATLPTPAPSPCSNLQPEPQGVGAAQLPHPVRDPVGVQCTQQVPEGGGDSWAPGGSWGYPQGSSSGAASSWGYPQGSSSSGASAVPRSAHGWAQCWVRREDRKLRPSGRTGERGGKSQKWFGGKFGDKGWGTASGEQPWCYPKRRREHR